MERWDIAWRLVMTAAVIYLLFRDKKQEDINAAYLSMFASVKNMASDMQGCLKDLNVVARHYVARVKKYGEKA